MKKFAYIAGGLSAAISMASYGFGYDSLTDEPSGSRATERHVIQFTTEASDCPSVAACSAAASIESEFVAVLAITNTTTCAAPTGQCLPGAGQSSAVDTYQGAGGTATTGAAPAAPITEIFLPQCPVGAAPCLRDVTLTTSFDQWDFTTDINGKLASGYLVADSSFASSGTVGVFLLDENVVRTYRGSSSQLIYPCATDINSDFTTCWTDDPATTADGPATEQHFDLVTVPDDMLSEKSVPVPAFAAAALGLGLIGITVLTGRRRQIK